MAWLALDTPPDCPLGRIHLVVGPYALHQVLLPTDFPHALPRQEEDPRHPILLQARAQLLEYFAGTRVSFSLPLPAPDPGFAGAAQAALGQIPYGHRWSYAQLADTAGNPRAARAAGSACARNPLPLILPCHRVGPASGALGNYRGGSDAKRWLIAHEAAHLSPGTGEPFDGCDSPII
ncbi:methylated-DNA--[protein]-cysteine S-methyltransferase [Corynebacterium lizhenjunii]|uniref:methylated-DNA--[protein]-cysteine S-methyltransferase n=1 Tax=Corynebacterium lizhenjunii TaxID=2709394 RepID=A0A7T0KFU6_9CORY|nr:methylated-DNA--[protein]-cysteine S-methyltransferase [Corynebacterium lizhenjunii]QPK79807.1 methylated-DNA--[protein]-cysteine S-methyltransferase [Corynebacterium lizhenjunii]